MQIRPQPQSPASRRVSTAFHSSPFTPKAAFLDPKLQQLLEVGVVILEDGQVPNNSPQFILPDLESGCRGLFFVKLDKTAEFRINHGGRCACLVKGKKDEVTPRLTPELSAHRGRLVRGEIEGMPKLKSRTAAMVVMKILMGMEVPEGFRIRDTRGNESITE
ncbi:uncharacterized protein BCR38DRAFT_412741 [Pseudomassariella vexata]|uniref:Uncharacterized protein n=1 Tax=Pseudomassariella vexata TaxID=1141098 RepID=A0A1Y2DKE1_9PEZI|nr:uncharacterized protein BCR38DRAFT_412741 [Pseudomassariella vexata]ORY59748.1 hypothetical protein BCR38DRAFT_412741 [Pseudomassariella vexata]